MKLDNYVEKVNTILKPLVHETSEGPYVLARALEQFDLDDDLDQNSVMWFFESYAAQKMLKALPVIHSIHKTCVERKFTARKKFEYHCDCKLWYIPNRKYKVFVIETQSQCFLFIFDDGEIHIRRIHHPTERDGMPKLKYYADRGFEVVYKDGRDKNYVASMTGLWWANDTKPNLLRVEHAIHYFSNASRAFWEIYHTRDTLELEFGNNAPA